MANVSLVLYVIFFLGVRSQSQFCNENRISTLQQVIVVFRHGDRNPEGTFPNDIYQEKDWPLGWGELIPNGTLRHFEYGKWTRSCYNSFLNETLSVKRVYVRSSDIDRTLMSAQAHLAGVYPPKAAQV